MTVSGLVPELGTAEKRKPEDSSPRAFAEREGSRSAAPPGSCRLADAPRTGAFAAVTNLVERLERSVWCAVLLKVGGVGLALLLLAGVGAYSTLAGLRGVPIPLEGPEKKDVASAWLAAAPARAAPPSAPPPANPSAPAAKAAEKTECGKAGGCDGDARKPDGDPAKKDRGVTADGKVILNLATADELTRLPGVGKKRAEAIVELRTRLKRFRRVTDLLRVRGIGVKSLRRITPLVVLDPPSESSPAPDAGAEPAPPERVPSPS